ncbi:MAG: phosphopantetheine-binding protein [Bacteroidia bacterium]|nr:phosphopantetheine-binding protein [Bacteroidia bacterium]
MNKTELIQQINENLAEEFEVDIETISPDAPLMSTLDLDSLDLVDMVVLVEQNFKFTPKATDFKGIVTFQDFYDFIGNKMNGQ